VLFEILHLAAPCRNVPVTVTLGGLGSSVQAFFQIFLVIMFAAAMVVCPIAWYRMVRAKTRQAYWGNMGLFAGLILGVFQVANLAGFDTGFREPAPPPQSIPSIENVFGQMPPIQLALLISAAVLWIGGGNLLFYLHRRRLGKRWWQALNPLDPPLKDFNTREWMTLGVLTVVSLGLGAAAMSVGRVA
jgi:hypothetical protein